MKSKKSQPPKYPTEGAWLINDSMVLRLLFLSTAVCIGSFFCLYRYARLLAPNEILLEAWGGTPIGCALSLPLLLAHEWVHGLAYRWAKTKPVYGFKVVAGFPALYATAPGYWLTRSEYVVIAIAPTIVINAIGLLLMCLMPNLRNGWLMAVDFHLGGCIGDWLMIREILRLPKGTEFEDIIEGFRYRLKPVAQPVPVAL